MVVPTQSGLLGVGLYRPDQAARYARVTTQMVNRWMHGDARGNRVIEPQLRDDPDRLVSFLDFIQILAIRSIRQKFRVPLRKIREAVQVARDRYRVDFPFAMPHLTFLFGQEILIRRRGDDDLTQVSGPDKHQLVARKIAELYLDDLHFEGIQPVVYDAFKYEDRRITMSPARLFGQPLLDTGHSADRLIQAYCTEGSVEAAAEVMGVAADDVMLAIRYDDFLIGKAQVSDAA